MTTLAEELLASSMTSLEAAALLEQIKRADDLVCGIHPYDVEWRNEMGSLRLDCRRVFERKFFEVECATDRVFDLGGDCDPPEYQPDEDGE